MQIKNAFFTKKRAPKSSFYRLMDDFNVPVDPESCTSCRPEGYTHFPRE